MQQPRTRNLRSLHAGAEVTGGSVCRPLRWRAVRGLMGALALTLTFMALGSLAAAQGSSAATEADPPMVALHYQDVLASEPPFIDLFVPPPAVNWHEFTYSAADCLRADGVHTGPPDKVIIVRFEVLEVGTCATKVDLLFSDGASSWAASAMVVANRLPDLPALDDLQPRFSRERVTLPGSGITDRPADLLLLGLTNPRAEPLTVLGLGNDEGFEALIGNLVSYDPASLMGRYSELARSGAAFEPTEVAPGDDAAFALVVSAAQNLPSGVGTVTVRPVAMVELAGQLYTLEFPRVSAAWGTELP